MRDKESSLTEIAPSVHYLRTGRGRFSSNVYLVQAGQGWVLVDTGWPGSQQAIITAAETVHGPAACPAAIILTHIHPDHSGALPELARHWEVPVYVHPAEVP